MSEIREKQLGQLAPADTNAASLFSPSVRTVVRQIIVCNTTAVAATFRIFIDNDGTTYSVATALFYDVTINGNTTVSINGYYPMDDANGNLAVRTGTANALTFTAFGAELHD